MKEKILLKKQEQEKKSASILLNNEANILLELIIYIFLSSLLITAVMGSVVLASKSDIKLRSINKSETNFRNIFNYIENEAYAAKAYIRTEDIQGFNHKYPNNIGVVFVIEKNQKNNIVTYYLRRNGDISRLATTYDEDRIPNVYDLRGFNVLGDNIKDIKTSLKDDKLRLELVDSTKDENSFSRIFFLGKKEVWE